MQLYTRPLYALVYEVNTHIRIAYTDIQSQANIVARVISDNWITIYFTP